MNIINAIIFSGFIIIALLSWFIWDKRYRGNHGTDIPEGYEATDEVFIDPSSGQKYKVYYNSYTGERYYKESQ